MTHAEPSRRKFVATGLGGAMAVLLAPVAHATPESMASAIAEFAPGEISEGRITLEIPPLVDSGNSVPLTVTVESPMTAEDHVETIAVFSERNPLPDVARFYLGPRSGIAKVTVRIRLSDTQHVVAVARMSDGSLWSVEKNVIVTAPACIEA